MFSPPATLFGGGVAERPNALALKARVRLRGPQVQILSPPQQKPLQEADRPSDDFALFSQRSVPCFV